MKWETIKDDSLLGEERYFLTLETKNYDYVKDEDIAQLLSLSLEEYLTILKKHNAILYREEYYFKNKRDIRAVIKTLQPHFIMATLTEE